MRTEPYSFVFKIIRALSENILPSGGKWGDFVSMYNAAIFNASHWVNCIVTAHYIKKNSQGSVAADKVSRLSVLEHGVPNNIQD